MNEFMNEQRPKVLLAGDDPGASNFLKKMLSVSKNADLEFIPIGQFSGMLHHNGEKAPDLILLDLPKAAPNPLSFISTARGAFPTVPVIVLMEKEDLNLAVQVISQGAQDCLAKSKLNPTALGRILQFTLARQRSIQQLRSLSLIDELTGLYNRRGFLALSEHQLKLADRTGQPLLLASVEVDGLKTINDLLGRQRGDLALIETAHILMEAFRETDILARLDGGKFAALLVCGEDIHAETLVRKFESTMVEHNFRGKSGFKLSASIAITISDPDSLSSIEDWMERADKLTVKRKISSGKNGVTHQLRFLKSVPISDWLKRTAVLLELMIPQEAWPAYSPSRHNKVIKIKKALEEGLLKFVMHWNLCGTDSVCDLCCSPAPENKSPDRFEACAILGSTRQYLVEGSWTLKEMSELLVGALLKELPVASSVSGKIQGILQDALSVHLYENTNCHRVPLCDRLEPLDLEWELHHSGRRRPPPMADRREIEAEGKKDKSKTLESFFENHRMQWERMLGEKFGSTLPEQGSSPDHGWPQRKNKIMEIIRLLRRFLRAK